MSRPTDDAGADHLLDIEEPLRQARALALTIEKLGLAPNVEIDHGSIYAVARAIGAELDAVEDIWERTSPRCRDRQRRDTRARAPTITLPALRTD